MEYALYLIAAIMMFLPSALSLNLVLGRAQLFHFGPVASSMIAAYALHIVLLSTGSFLLGILVSLFCTILLAFVFAWMSARLSDDALGVMTIAVHLIVLDIVLNSPSITGGSLGLVRFPRLPGFDDPFLFAIIATFIVGLWAGFLWWLDHGKFGRQLKALSEQPWTAEALGISRKKAHTFVFILAGFGAFLGGGLLYPQYIGILHPSDYQFMWLLFMLLCVIAGKPGSVRGVLIATSLLVLLKEGLKFIGLPSDILGPTRLILFGTILSLAVYFQRNSLFPGKRRL